MSIGAALDVAVQMCRHQLLLRWWCDRLLVYGVLSAKDTRLFSFVQSKPLVVVAPGTIGTGIIGGIVTGTIGGIVPGTIGINPSGTKSTRKRKKSSEYGIKRSGVN
jgi:hypothetical protein